jgi:hypothetical protein
MAEHYRIGGDFSRVENKFGRLYARRRNRHKKP